ncbi:DNA polymerase/3'-5' exonuclease PolX [soil metagenome]
MTRDDVATALEEIGTLLALQGENDFKVRAYSNAARTVTQLPNDLKEMIADGSLAETRGIGEALLEKITTLVTTGSLPYLEDLRKAVPPGLIEMLKLPGIGAKKVKLLHDALGIDTVKQLKDACIANKVSVIKGMGEKTQSKILEGIAFLDTVGKRVRIDLAYPLGEALLEQIKKLPGVQRSALCGSLRRRRETSKDIDILVSAKDAKPIMDAFVTLPEVLQVVGHGETKSSIVAALSIGGTKVVLNADLRVVQDDAFSFALAYFTGSKEHNIRMRQIAIEKGLSLNEYALAGKAGDVKCKSEEDIYTALGLDYVVPEMREDTGEMEAAIKHTLPKLIEASDIRGVFHNHTTASDGTASLEQMALAAKALGLEYFGVGDHSKSLTVANGLTQERVKAQWAEIDALNKKLKGITILKGTECDILDDGTMDFDDELLAGFDYVVASIHQNFHLSEAAQTARVCKALANPYVTMLGHATGRLLLRREGYRIDLEEVIRTAAKHKKMIEINAQPMRLDLDWTWVKRAKAAGVTIVINPDAHSPEELALYTYGVDVARRGWLTKEDVFNTKSVKDVMKALKK